MRHRLQLAFVTTAVAIGFLLYAAPDCLRNRATCFGNGQPIAPFVYRVLPAAVNAVIAPNATPEGALFADTLLQMACMVVIIPALYAWLYRWGSRDHALSGVYVFAVVWLLALHYWYLSVGTTLEVLFVVLALNLLNRTWLWFIPLIALASLNRETGLLIAGIYAAYHGRERRRESVALVLTWAGITILLHVVIGSFPHELGLLGTLQYNLGNLPDAIIANLPLIPLAIMVAIGYKSARKPLQRFLVVALVYAAAVVVGGSWMESERLLLPAFPLVIPLIFETKAAWGTVESVPYA